MIGNELIEVQRPNTYILSSVAGTGKVPTAQPPTNGCYIRVEGTGTAGSIVISGTVDGESTTETISSFDDENIGFGTKLFTAITSVNIIGFTSAILYPATESGEKINLSSYTTFNILADSYIKFLGEFSGQYTEFAGHRNKIYRSLMYDRRFTLQREDLITLDGEPLTVVDVSSQHGIYCALLTTSRTG